MIEKKTKALTKEAFEPFGQLITVPQDIAVEPGAVHGWARVATTQFPGEVEVGWLKLLRRPAEVTQMEHHLGTPELVIPLDVPLLVPVAPGARFKAGGLFNFANRRSLIDVTLSDVPQPVRSQSMRGTKMVSSPWKFSRSSSAAAASKRSAAELMQ